MNEERIRWQFVSIEITLPDENDNAMLEGTVTLKTDQLFNETRIRKFHASYGKLIGHITSYLKSMNVDAVEFSL